MVCGGSPPASPATSAANSARRFGPSIRALKAAFARIPWRSALSEERALPSRLRGPVERLALARLAASLRSLTGLLGVGLGWGSIDWFIVSLRPENGACLPIQMPIGSGR